MVVAAMEVVTVEVVVQGRVEHPLSTSFLRVHASLLVSCCPQWLAVCDGGGRGPRNILRCSSEGKAIDTQESGPCPSLDSLYDFELDIRAI